MTQLHVRWQEQFLWLVLDHPPLNVLTENMLQLLLQALQEVEIRRPKLLVLTGLGERSFCRGVSLKGDSDAEQAKFLLAARAVEEMWETLRQRHLPSVALIRGDSWGAGCELALLCDTVIAHEDARLRLPSTQFQLFPQRFSHFDKEKIPPHKPLLSAHEAWRLGFVDQVLSSHNFQRDANQLLLMLSLC